MEFTTRDHTLVNDSRGNLVRKTDNKTGLSESWEYAGAYGQVSKHVDKRGHVETWGYNGYGMETRYAYDEGGAEEHVYMTSYDAYGNMAEKTVRSGADGPTEHWNWEYDDRGNLIRTIDAWGAVTDLGGYDALGNPGWIRQDGREWKYTYDARGLETSMTDPQGRTSTNQYDGMGRLIHLRTVDGEESWQTWSRDGYLLTISNQWGYGAAFSYDVCGRQTGLRDTEGNTETWTYDAQGHLQFEGQELLKWVESSQPGVVEGVYTNEAGEVFRMTMDQNTEEMLSLESPSLTTFFTYTNRAVASVTVISPEWDAPRISQYGRDAYGQMTYQIDALSNRTSYVYDEYGRQIAMTNALGATRRWNWARGGMLVGFTDGLGHEVSFAYDGPARRKTTTLPEGTTYETESNPRWKTVRQGSASGTETRTQFDLMGRATNLSIFAHADDIEPSYQMWYEYDPHADDRISRVGASDGEATYENSYDESTWTQSVTVTFDNGMQKTYRIHQNAQGKIVQLDRPDGMEEHYAYAEDGTLQSVTWGGRTMVSSTSRNGRTNETVYPGGIRRITERNVLGHVTNVLWTSAAGDVLQKLTYQYDALDRVTNATAGAVTRQYQYNAVGCLTQEKLGNNAETYQYDAEGNRTSRNGGAAWVYEGENRLCRWPEGEYTWNTVGQVVQRRVGDQNQQFEYDVLDRITTVRDAAGDVVATYGYDSMGRRVRKTVNGRTIYYLWGNNGLLAEYDEEGNTLREYGWLPGSVWMMDPVWMKVGEQTYYYFDDRQGAPVALATEDGQLTWTSTANAFGVKGCESGMMVQPIRLSGQYLDEETGLHYNTMRYYDPETGRYLTRDPMGYDGGWNVHLFVESDPVNHRDPMGLYDINVHFYMTYIMARNSGMTHERALQVAYAAQYPDTDQRLDATDRAVTGIARQRVPIWTVNAVAGILARWNGHATVGTMDWAKKIQAIVHQLSGNSPARHKCVRDAVASIYKKGWNTSDPDWQFKTDMLLHIFEDTFGHSKYSPNGGDTGMTYDNSGKGHMWDGNQPDCTMLRKDLSRAAINATVELLCAKTGHDVKSAQAASIATFNQIAKNMAAAGTDQVSGTLVTKGKQLVTDENWAFYDAACERAGIHWRDIPRPSKERPNDDNDKVQDDDNKGSGDDTGGGGNTSSSGVPTPMDEQPSLNPVSSYHNAGGTQQNGMSDQDMINFIEALEKQLKCSCKEDK